MTNWKSILKMPISDERKDVTEWFMLKDDVWKEAGGRKYNEGFRYAHLDDIEEILGRKLNIHDFTKAPVNWVESKPYIIERIGEEGRKILAEKYLKFTKPTKANQKLQILAVKLLKT